jgi:hypothetical protein
LVALFQSQLRLILEVDARILDYHSHIGQFKGAAGKKFVSDNRSAILVYETTSQTHNLPHNASLVVVDDDE